MIRVLEVCIAGLVADILHRYSGTCEDVSRRDSDVTGYANKPERSYEIHRGTEPSVGIVWRSTTITDTEHFRSKRIDRLYEISRTGRIQVRIFENHREEKGAVRRQR